MPRHAVSLTGPGLLTWPHASISRSTRCTPTAPPCEHQVPPVRPGRRRGVGAERRRCTSQRGRGAVGGSTRMGSLPRGGKASIRSPMEAGSNTRRGELGALDVAGTVGDDADRRSCCAEFGQGLEDGRTTRDGGRHVVDVCLPELRCGLAQAEGLAQPAEVFGIGAVGELGEQPLLDLWSEAPWARQRSAMASVKAACRSTSVPSRSKSARQAMAATLTSYWHGFVRRQAHRLAGHGRSSCPVSRDTSVVSSAAPSPVGLHVIG